MNEVPLKQVISASLENLKQVIDVDNVIGKPIPLQDGGVVIPVSKVTLGFSAGGADFDGKRNPTRDTPHFGGGAGSGMTIAPIAFLIVRENDVRLLNVNQPANEGLVGTISDLLEKAPEFTQKIKSFFRQRKEEKEAEKAEADEASDEETAPEL